MEAAVRAPDHGRLRPWRFLTIRGDDRTRFGELLAAALARKEPETPGERLEHERSKALRAPLIIVVADHSKIPAVEQLLSAGAAA
jgi:nitroreductase